MYVYIYIWTRTHASGDEEDGSDLPSPSQPNNKSSVSKPSKSALFGDEEEEETALRSKKASATSKIQKSSLFGEEEEETLVRASAKTPAHIYVSIYIHASILYTERAHALLHLKKKIQVRAS